MITGPEPIPLKGRQVPMRVAAEMIPYRNAECLRKWLSRHASDFPGRYRMLEGHLVRVLWESEVAAIQRRLVKLLPPSHWGRKPRVGTQPDRVSRYRSRRP